MSTEKTENKNQVVKIDQMLAQAKSLKDLFTMPFVIDRFIKNYAAVSGRSDGEARFEQERFAYMQIVAEKPEMKDIANFYHMGALVYAGTTGLSFRDNKLYVYPNGKGGLKVQPSPAGRREMMEMMPTIHEVPEPILVMKGDTFVHDKLNNVVKVHETTDKSETTISLDSIKAVYVRVYKKDKTIKDVVVYRDDLLKAKAKSKTKADDSNWNLWPGEMSKKTAINRAFRLYHKYPDNVVIYGSVDQDEEEQDKPKDISHTDLTEDDFQTTPSGDKVDTSSGEVITPEVVDQKKAKKEVRDLTAD